MIILKINTGKFRPFFRLLTYILIFCMLLMDYACVTTEEKTMSAKQFNPKNDIVITGVVFKDGRFKKFGVTELEWGHDVSPCFGDLLDLHPYFRVCGPEKNRIVIVLGHNNEVMRILPCCTFLL